MRPPLRAGSPIAVLALVLAALLALGGCGESQEDKAKNAVCDARDDLGEQVRALGQLSITTATTDEIETRLNAISSDLSKIRDAQGDLADDRQQQVRDATNTFTAQVRKIAASVPQSLSLSGARSQLAAAFDQLAAAYRNAFRQVDCS
jgi:hypothetical protein